MGFFALLFQGELSSLLAIYTNKATLKNAVFQKPTLQASIDIPDFSLDLEIWTKLCHHETGKEVKTSDPVTAQLKR